MTTRTVSDLSPAEIDALLRSATRARSDAFVATFRWIAAKLSFSDHGQTARTA
jgi:hypothetical protein